VGYENILLEREGAVAILTINRPQVLNALNAATLRELDCALDEVAADDGVRALVITGAGEKAFVAGADINELRAMRSGADAVRFAQRGQALLFKLERLEKPVIMAINGFALGGGCEMAMAGDIRIAADTARLGQPEVNLGLIPGYGGTQRLARLAGRGAAKLLAYTGDMIGAAEALRVGLVDRVVPAADLMREARALADKLAGKAPVALAMAKRSIDGGLDVDLESGCALEAACFGVSCATEDRVEGTAAFLEKRAAKFKGR